MAVQASEHDAALPTDATDRVDRIDRIDDPRALTAAGGLSEQVAITPTGGAEPIAEEGPAAEAVAGKQGFDLLRRTSIKQRLWGMTILGIVVFALMSTLSVLRLAPVKDDVRANETTQHVVARVSEAYERFTMMRADLHGYVNAMQWDVNGAASYAQQRADAFDEDFAAAKTALADAAEEADPATKEAIDTAAGNIAEYNMLLPVVMADVEAGQLDEAFAKLLDDTSDAVDLTKTVEDELSALVDGATIDSAHRASSIEDSTAGLGTLMIVIAIAGALIFLVVAWLVIGRITRPLSRVVTVLQAIATGDRTKRIDYGRSDEIGHIADSIVEVVASLDAADVAAAAARAEREERREAERLAAMEQAAAEARALEERATAEAERRDAELQRERERQEAERAAAAAEREREQASADAERARERAEAEADAARAAEAARLAEETAARVAVVLDYVQQVAEGDLTHELEVSGDDAIGQMADALRRLTGALRASMAQIGQTSTAMAAAAEELTTVSEEMTRGTGHASDLAGSVSASAEQVSANVGAVATAAEQMSSSIHEIARNASEASTVAAEAVEVATEARTTVDSLGVSSAEISQVIKLITSIAAQTNLLALNATIEAARAGDAGKGFAVVANEVKELAGETAKATDEIGRRIETIQSDTGNAVEAITRITSVIGQINSITGTIAAAVAEQTTTTNEIARSVTEAASGADGIASDITRVASATTQAQAGAQGTSSAAAELADMATTLDRLVGGFRC